MLAACDGDKHVSVYTPIGELQFADPGLRACVLAEAERRGWDTSGRMTEPVCTNPEGDQVEDLAGIENLVNLQLLDLAHNAISDISLMDNLDWLPPLRHIEDLSVNHNQLQNLQPVVVMIEIELNVAIRSASVNGSP